MILPLARLQSVALSQGPLGRSQKAATLTGHTVAGQVPGAVGALDRDDAVAVWQRAATAVTTAAASDRSHRWDAAPPASPVPITIATTDQEEGRA